MERNYRSLKALKSYVAVLTLALVIFHLFPALSWSRSKKLNRVNPLQDAQTYDQKMQKRYRNDFNLPDKHWSYAPSTKRGFYPLLSKNYKKRYECLKEDIKSGSHYLSINNKCCAVE